MQILPALTNRSLSSQVRVRHVMRTDLPALEWDGEYTYLRRVYADTFERSMRGLAVLWAAELPGTGIIGQVFIQLVCDREELADGLRRAYLFSFRVRPQYRSLGVGTRMLDVVHRDLQLRGFHSVTLNVAKENLRAQEMYQRNGYVVVAHEPGIWSYPDENGVWHQMEEPAWRMEKQL